VKERVYEIYLYTWILAEGAVSVAYSKRGDMPPCYWHLKMTRAKTGWVFLFVRKYKAKSVKGNIWSFSYDLEILFLYSSTTTTPTICTALIF